jgi:uncharacterized phage-associated protein
MNFREDIAAQVAAYFVKRAGGSLNVLKLMKLMYLAERECLAKYGSPMMGDDLVSMPHGPVLSRSKDHMDGSVRSRPGGWDDWISDRDHHLVALVRDLNDPREDLLALSDADLQIVDEVWDKFGAMAPFDLRDYTHDQCDEWEDPNGSSAGIPYVRLLRSVGYSAESARELADAIAERKTVDTILDRATR